MKFPGSEIGLSVSISVHPLDGYIVMPQKNGAQQRLSFRQPIRSVTSMKGTLVNG